MKQLLAASALLCLASLAAAEPPRIDRATVENGKSVFLRVGCFTCHGTVGHHLRGAGGLIESIVSPGCGIESVTPRRSAAARRRSGGSVQAWSARMFGPCVTASTVSSSPGPATSRPAMVGLPVSATGRLAAASSHASEISASSA